MKTERLANPAEIKPLVAETDRDAICPEQGCKQVAFGITEAGAVFQYFGCRQGYRVFPEIATVPDFIMEIE